MALSWSGQSESHQFDRSLSLFCRIFYEAGSTPSIRPQAKRRRAGKFLFLELGQDFGDLLLAIDHFAKEADAIEIAILIDGQIHQNPRLA